MLQPRNNVQRQLYCSKCFTVDVKADYLGMAMFWAFFVCLCVCFYFTGAEVLGDTSLWLYKYHRETEG